MHFPSLLSLLASSVALTLSHAAVVDKRDCTPAVHTGTIAIYSSTTTWGNGVTQENSIYVNQATFQKNFGLVKYPAQYGQFRFTGCQGGDMFRLYCMNCGVDTGSTVAVANQDFDSNGQPQNWVATNYGPPPTSREDLAERETWVESMSWIWDTNGFMHPVTYSLNGTRLIMNTDAYDALLQSPNQFAFSSKAHDDKSVTYYAWYWTENP